ncbi:rho GTPase-activating protein 22-like [Sinocyclocheilus grahami]|uniref:rho GTPase-activating protein 22-like n=1 Tax=Sinocyclocheilus grahami TaxID=75366 RepID=UPI0007ACD02B|nr:PREDICTED: rho GTPase-activating protein 22-like [Sinocyclocheilus grahami]
MDQSTQASPKIMWTNFCVHQIRPSTSLVQHLMTLLISKHDRLYTEKDSETSQNQMEVKDQSQQHQQSKLVDWISEEDLQTCKNDNPTSSSASSVDAAITSKPVPQGKGETAVSPSKQAKALPGWKYTFKGSSPRPPSAKVCSSAVDVSTASSGNWLMNGLSSLRGHRRTSSGERSRDSGSSQRLSTYDNVTSSSSLGSVLSMDSTPWSSSSCEIFVPDSGRDPLGTEDGPQTEASAQEERSEEEAKPSEQEEDVGSAVENRASGLFCSDNGNVAPVIRVVDEDTDANGGPSSLASIVEDLKEELRKQKQTYESRIQKLEESSSVLCAQMERLQQEMEQERKKKRMLEESSSVLCAQMERLQQEMEQERKKKRMLEIKLRNSERAREDAENRNRLLEKEMEDFFSTLGDLALGSRTSDI